MIDDGTDFFFRNSNKFVDDFSSNTLSGFEKSSDGLQYSIIPASSAEITQSNILLNASATTGFLWIEVRVCNGSRFSPRPSKIVIVGVASSVTASKGRDARSRLSARGRWRSRRGLAQPPCGLLSWRHNLSLGAAAVGTDRSEGWSSQLL